MYINSAHVNFEAQRTVSNYSLLLHKYNDGMEQRKYSRKLLYRSC